MSFEPTDISGVVWWDPTGLTPAKPSSWPASDSDYDLEPSSGEPALVADARNGLSTMQYVADDEDCHYGDLPEGWTPLTVSVAFRIDGTGGYTAPNWAAPGPLAERDGSWGVSAYTSGGKHYLVGWQWSSDTAHYTDPFEIELEEWVVATLVISTTHVKLRVNGVDVGTPTSLPNSTGGYVEGWYVGSTSWSWMTGQVGDITFHEGVLSDPDIEAIEGFMGRWLDQPDPEPDPDPDPDPDPEPPVIPPAGPEGLRPVRLSNRSSRAVRFGQRLTRG